MRKFAKESVVLFLQLTLFYVLPLFSFRLGAIGMVVLILFGTFILSLFLGILSKNRIKFLWPAAVAILFLPSVFLFYNATAVVHSTWYFLISGIGMLIGAVINRLR